MNLTQRCLCLIALLALSGGAQAVEPRAISWDTLAPPATRIENPFESLTSEQMDKLRLILRFEMRSDRAEDGEAFAETRKLRETLTAEGLDVDALFAARNAIIEQRQADAARVNEDILGARVRMPGFVLPLAFEGRKATEFLLVATVGACVHTPPPPANQIVHVVYPQGIEVDGLFNPVWITGTMSARSSVQNVAFSDGQAAVSVSYTMHPELVVKYSE